MSDKQKKPEFSLDGILNNPESKKHLLGYIEEIVLLEEKIKRDREGIKDIKSEAETELGIPSNSLNELVREKLDQGSIAGKIHKLEEVKDLAVGLGITEE